jgi:hypothetical protein
MEAEVLTQQERDSINQQIQMKESTIRYHEERISSMMDSTRPWCDLFPDIERIREAIRVLQADIARLRAKLGT